MRQITRERGPWTWPAISHDGKWIAFTGYPWSPQTYHAADLYVIGRDGSGMRKISGDLDRDPEYRGLLENRIAMRQAVVDLMDKHRVDVLIYPHKLFPPTKLGPKDEGPWANQLSSLTSLPSLVVPSGFSPEGLPFGFEILGRPWSEPLLLRVASGFEAVTQNRRAPPTTPPLPGEDFDY